ncbi:MAG: arginine N-succinyltransferase [Pseudomonadaceae bacterium]|nr:arginine N-succinyltransferase [Pseudomonadaceae bacterium]
MAQLDTQTADPRERRGFSGKQVLLFVLLALLVGAGITYWYVRTYFYASSFDAVALSEKEQVRLDNKLSDMGLNPQDLMPNAARPATSSDRFAADGRLIPEAYSEEGARRDVRLSERELNAMVASNADLASRFAIDLSDDLASAKLLVPMDPDFPVFGGQTLRLTAGLELAYANGRPKVVLKGVSVGGIPMPAAWLGGLKNVDLVEQFGGDPGFWQAFAAGIDSIAITDGNLAVTLKE